MARELGLDSGHLSPKPAHSATTAHRLPRSASTISGQAFSALRWVRHMGHSNSKLEGNLKGHVFYFLGFREDYVSTFSPNIHTISLSSQLAAFKESHTSFFLDCARSLRCWPCPCRAHSLTEEKGQGDPRNLQGRVQVAVHQAQSACCRQIVMQTH